METKHYDFIDALRGYAILAVMAVHASQAAPDLLGVGRLLVDQGARGVQLFFVASALTLAMSWNARNDGILPFYLRRLIRIAPMFWLGILFFLWLDGFGPRYFAPNGIDGISVFLTVLFLHGWHPETITSVVHGGWSIAVEMTFYFVFPLLAFVIRGLISAFVALVITSAFGNLALGAIWSVRHKFWPDISDDLVSTFLSLWFPTQFPVFIVGFLLYFCVRNYKGRLPVWAARLMLAGSLLLMITLAVYPLPIRKFGISSYTAYGLCFGVFAFCLADGAAKWLVNTPIRYLGKISFSAYLWHFAVLGTVGKVVAIGIDPLSLMTPTRGALFFVEFFTYVVLMTTILSTLTYRLVERPMIKVGNKIIDQLAVKSQEIVHSVQTEQAEVAQTLAIQGKQNGRAQECPADACRSRDSGPTGVDRGAHPHGGVRQDRPQVGRALPGGRCSGPAGSLIASASVADADT